MRVIEAMIDSILAWIHPKISVITNLNKDVVKTPELFSLAKNFELYPYVIEMGFNET